MKTAIIGLGSIGSAVATNLVAGGADVIVAARTLAKAQDLATTLGPHAEAMSSNVALGAADIVVLAIWFDAIKDFVSEHRDALIGKILVDPSNPIAPDGKGGFKKIIPDGQSSGEIIAGLLPAGAKFVKAFGTLSAVSLASASNRSPERVALFYATDDADAGNEVAELIAGAGFAPVSAGGVDQSIRLEVFGDLHELGGLGRPVTEREAAAAIARAPV